MSVQAGDVYYANLDPAHGTEQKGTRPVIVISAVPMGPRAIVVPMTTKIRSWPTRVRIRLYGTDAEAMCEQVRTIDVTRLNEDLYARIDPASLSDIQRIVARLVGVY